jgi:fucose permease
MLHSYLQVFLTVSLPIVGLAYALLGAIKLPLVERLGIDEGKVGRLVGGFGTMFGPTILLCGFLTDAVGRKGVWVAGSVAVAAAIFLFSTARTFRAALAGALLLGAGWAAQINVGNVLMRVAVAADRPREELIWATNFFDFVFGLGTFIGPLVLAPALRRLGYRRGLTLFALVALTPAGLGLFADMNPAAAASAPTVAAAGGLGALLGSPFFWVIGLAFLFYVPLETSVGGWATTLVVRQTPTGVPVERSKRVAAIALSGFWLGFTGSRLAVSILGTTGVLPRLLGARNEQLLLLAMAIACLVLTIAIVALRGRAATIVTVVLCGVACGPVFPTMMAIVLLSVPADTMGRAVGIFFFFASVGWTVIPALIGAVARRTNDIQRGFVVAAASSALFLLLTIARGVMTVAAR